MTADPCTPPTPTTTGFCGGTDPTNALPLFLIQTAHEIDSDVRHALGLTASDCVYHLHRCPMNRAEEQATLTLLARLTFCAGYTRPDLCDPLLSLYPTLRRLGCEGGLARADALWQAGRALFGWASLDCALLLHEAASPR